MEPPMQAASTSTMPISDASLYMRSGGAGQDFVLFDDSRLQQGGQSSMPMMSSQGLLPQQTPAISMSANPSMTSRPSFEPKSSFTEYRASQSGQQIESPYSSPASKPEDDFSSDQGHTMDSYHTDSGSGTLAHGTPKSKRQRGHGYSSSWTGGNFQQHRLQSRNQQASGGTLASAMDPNSSFVGFGPGGTSRDWKATETSPQIHSLSLGDGGGDGAIAGMSSLFPAATKNGPDPLMQANYQNPVMGPLSYLISSQQEQEKARQQIRAELAGVDSRALKGPLRDIQQGTGQETNPNLFSNLDFASMQPNSFFPGMQGKADNAGSFRQRSGSLDESFLSSNPNILTEGLDNSQMGWNGLGTGDANSFDLQGLDNFRMQQRQQQQYAQQRQQQSQSQSSSPPSRPDISGRQFSSRTQQAIDRARAQKPTRKRLTRDGSGLTISPQEAFLDYNNVDNLLQASQSQAQSLPSTAQNLFAPPPPNIDDILHSDSLALTPKAGSFEEYPSFRPSSLISTHEATPSLIDASSNSSNGSRATSIISSPLQRMPLNREDTARPSKSQQALAALQSSSTSDLFSPAYSTSSSTDDEDEKPYEPNHQSNPRVQFPFPAQSNNSATSASGQASHSGPRFSVVSSSSSESEDDDQRGRSAKNMPMNLQGRRTMGGYGYMGSSQESGLNASSSNFNWQPVQGLQQHMSMEQSSFPATQPRQPQGERLVMNPSRTPQSAGGQSDSQSQDEGPSLSPLIRNSAQAIKPADSRQPVNVLPSNHDTHTNVNTQARQRSRSRNRAQVATAAAATVNRKGSSEAGSSSFEETSEWETGEDSEADGSDYRDDKGTTNGGSKSSTKKRQRGGNTRRGGGTQTASGTGSSGSHLTVCDYVSPLTGDSCKTEFHRPYDLARHRETIHAREEALLLRQGRLTKQQCVVLYKEVDPEKSLATVEWRCEGKNGCGSLFSRKDALLRHKRIRGH